MTKENLATLHKQSGILLILLSVLCLVIFAVRPVLAELTNEDLSKKVRLHTAEKTRLALVENSRKLLSPEDAKVFEAGLDAQFKKRYKKAIAFYQRVLNSHPDLFEASYNLGLCQENLASYSEARRTFQNLLKASPTWDLGRKHLAYIAFKQGDLETARSYYYSYLTMCRTDVTDAEPDPPFESKSREPLLVIAPDLIVESFEFGEFPDGAKEPDPGKERFIPKQKTPGGFIGYRLKLRTSRKEITWRHQLDTIEGKNHKESVNNGTIYCKWVIVAGFPKGKHTLRGWVEDVELPPITYTVK